MKTFTYLSTHLLRLRPYMLSAIALTLLLVLTLTPGNELPKNINIPYIDKWAHVLMFGLVATAIILDYSRQKRRLTWPTWLATAIVMTILGIVIEWAQEALAWGRSGEIADAVADAIGALLLPLCFRKPIKAFLRINDCHINEVATPDSKTLSRVHDLYHDAFPEEERRPWADLTAKIADSRVPLNLTVVNHAGRFAGFITWWMLDNGTRYIEHFAIDQQLRGGGIGAKAIDRFVRQHPSPVILEAEPPELNAIAASRINFYRRAGFTPHLDFNYIQPPYTAGQPSLKLVLLTVAEHDAAPWPSPEELARTAALIHKQIYNFPTE